MISEIVKINSTNRVYEEIISDLSADTEKIFQIDAGQKLAIDLTFIQGSQYSYNLKLLLVGSGAEVKMRGLLIGYDDNLLNMNIEILHQAPATKADVKFRGIITGHSKQDWRGLIKIDKIAQKTKSWLEDRTLLLSPNARALAVPSLEIEANEVRASHAATVSRINKEQIYYLMTRGITEADAQQLIVRGFISPVLPTNEDDRERIESLLNTYYT